MEQPERGEEEATRWRERAMRDEYGRLPEDGRLKALQQLEENLAYTNARKMPKSIETPVWTAQGPTDRGGRARALVIHPQESQILWAATGSGGIWKSEDGGSSWRPLNDRLGLPAGSLAIDPRNPDILYFGTGERFHSGGPGAGIFKSRDGGTSWQRLASTRLWRYVPSIAISPANSNVLLAAVADPEFPARSGVFRSSNGGQTWKRVLQSTFFTPSVLIFQPRSGSRILLAVRDGLFPSGEAKVMLSDDGGVTWRRSGGLGTMQFTRYEIAYSSSQPQVAYAISREGTFRSDDGGASFVQRSTVANFGLVNYASMLWVSPTNPNFLLAGGVSIARSRDGGITWERLDYFDERNRDVGHADYQAAIADVGFNGTSNRRVYILNDGGIDRINDVLARPLAPRHAVSLDRGMQTTEFYAVAGRQKDGLLLGGTQDRGVIQTRVNAARSTLAVGGDGACSLIDPADGRYLYGCAQFLWIDRIQPKGLIGLTNDLPDSNPVNVEQTANFIAPVLLDPNAPFRMLGGGVSLWRSENVRNATHQPGHRAVWVAIKPPLQSAFPGDDSHLISAIAIAKGDSNNIWVGHNGGRLFHTANGLAAAPGWDAIDDNASHNPLPNRWPNRIVVDVSNRRRVYVAFGGFVRNNVWRSDDGGMTWHSASGHIPTALSAAPVWSLVQHPQESNTLVAGTEVGVFITRNAGASWTAIRAPFTAAAQDVSFLQGSTTLLVGTYGRGLWTIDLE
jgi:photosystem II stability/assembly factor-like uncharacterized protein